MDQVRELGSHEQIRVSIEEAGKLYNGNFILFTNTEETWEADRWKSYGVPRVIAINESELCKSGLHEKYRGEVYGVVYYCAAFVSADQIPPILAF